MKKFVIVSLIVVIILTGVSFYLINDYYSKPNQEVVLQDLDVSKLTSFESWWQDKEEKYKIELATREPEITLFAVGDIMLSRMVGQKMVKYDNYDYPFKNVTDIISLADIAIANLESPINPGAPVVTGSFNFRADPEVAEALKKAGFDALGLANNHILNQGQKGLENTVKYLAEQDIKYFGLANNSSDLETPIAIIEKKGKKFAFLAYAYGPDYYAAGKNSMGMIILDDKRLKQDLNQIKDQVDFIVVTMHDGIEYEHTSSKHQQDFAHLAIDLGADLVIGHHPHVVQEMEIYNGKYIFYSLGNFIFDQMWSEATREGLAVKFTIHKEEVIDIEYYPVMNEDYSQPRFADDEESETILNYLQLEKLASE